MCNFDVLQCDASILVKLLNGACATADGQFDIVDYSLPVICKLLPVLDANDLAFVLQYLINCLVLPSEDDQAYRDALTCVARLTDSKMPQCLRPSLNTLIRSLCAVTSPVDCAMFLARLLLTCLKPFGYDWQDVSRSPDKYNCPLEIDLLTLCDAMCEQAVPA